MVEAFDTDPPCTNATTFLNVDNLPKNIYELNEINQHFSKV
jgi:hypothetical protein